MKYEKKICINALLLIIIYLVFAGVKIWISFYMKSPFVFSDEQSYFGMADKIIKGKFWNIYNSHMPGYSLIISPAYLITSNVIWAYRGALITNSLIGSLPVFITYYICHKTFKLELNQTYAITILCSLASAFYAYNYVIMSETLMTVVYFIAFALFLDIIVKRKSDNNIKWIIMGVIIGFLPIIKTQATTTFILYIIFVIILQLIKDTNLEKKRAIYSVITAICVYCIFKYIIFKNIGLYEGQSEENIRSLFTIFKSFNNLKTFINIVFGELSYFVVSTGLIPTFFVIMTISLALKRINLNRTKISKTNILIIMFISSIVIMNLALTIIHAYFVYQDLGIETVYTRYIDFLQPWLIVLGLVAMYKVNWDGVKDYILKSCIKDAMLLLAIFVFVEIDKIEINTFSVYFYSNINYHIYICIFILTSYICLFYGKKYIKPISVFLSMLILYLAMDYSVIKVQLQYGSNMVSVYPEPYFIADNNIVGETIVLDSDITEGAKKEDYYGNGSENEIEDVNKHILVNYNYKYSLMFWAIKNNSVHTEEVSKDIDSYVCTNKLLTRNLLSAYGPVMIYDKKNLSDYRVSADLLFRTTEEQLKIISSEYVQIQDRSTTTRLFLDNIHKVKIKIKYSDNCDMGVYSKYIRCKLGDQEMQYLSTNEDNVVEFMYESENELNINSLTVSYSDKFAQIINNNLLYIGYVDISYE